MIIVILIAIVALAIWLGVALLKFRNNALVYKEKIKKAKSHVRVAQNKYVKSLKNTAGALELNTNTDGGVGLWSGDMGAAAKYGTNTELVRSLAESYEQAQNLLNELISQYNFFISKFPNLIFAAILRYKKENYIDEENLDMSTSLSGIDESIV